MKTLELLAPAKDLDCGKAAVNCGADAVYIGIQSYSARSRAGNSIEDISQLVHYAHRYHARVYCAFNTLLYDDELDDVQKTAVQLYEAGVDALIVQDLAFLEMDIPPIALHASTQTACHDIKRAEFLSKSGFSRIILPRELSLEKIREFNTALLCETECFVHGALCVSYSGNCYISASEGGRSANRGECAQPCRKAYTLQDSDGTILVKNEHLLSLPDMNRLNRLRDLADAGISSFKIEGRLKDITYVKNITAAYRQQLDRIIENTSYKRASSGKPAFSFIPDVEKSFNRGFTEYGLDENASKESYTSPKSLGKKIGIVASSSFNGTNWKGETLRNGDGICYMKDGKLEGTQVLIKNGNLMLPEVLPKGTVLYRNFDHVFSRTLQSDCCKRTISCSIEITQNVDEIELTAVDEDGYRVSLAFENSKDNILNKERFHASVTKAFSKSGDSIFSVIKITGLPACFYTLAKLNAMRRELLKGLESIRLESMSRMFRLALQIPPYPYSRLDYRSNVTNRLSRSLYEKSGCLIEEKGFELLSPDERSGKELMRCVYCVMKAAGVCGKKEVMLTDSGGNKFRLGCDPSACEMVLEKTP